MDHNRFLRSINIAQDVEHPERFLHFRPTSKSVNLIDSVMGKGGERALLVVAPYGSGKSLASGYLLHAIQNEPDRYGGGESLLRTVAERVGEVSPDLQVALDRRRGKGEMGVSASLHGHYADTAAALQDALHRAFGRAGLGREGRAIDRERGNDAEGVTDLLATVTSKMEKVGRDHLLIVWDEFGRHLEELVAQGRPGELLALQVLAEAASRAKNVRVTLLLLLHRSFMGYAAGLPTSARQEWAKIEGRFQIVQFVDDSLEMHRLLASVANEIKPPPAVRAPEPGLAVRQAQEVGFFGGVPSDALKSTLQDAWPLEPATLWLLPRIASRVAQHERTSFSFLHSSDLSAPVGPEHLFDYFRGEFQADSGPGGTHKAWLEVESALAKVPTGSVEATVLKTAFLLGLGLGGERSRATRAQLELAAAGTSLDRAGVRDAIEGLLQRKLLVHRRQNDQVLVWHGTDVDLRGRLDDERRRLDGSFDLVSFLSREAPPPVWRPTRHNAETGVLRYLESRYVSPNGMKGYLEQVTLGLRAPGTDGVVLYVLPSTEEEFKGTLGLARSVADPRVFIAVARVSEVLTSVALELAALLRMHQDHELLTQDPMVRSELDLLTDDVRQGLRPSLSRLVTPGGGGAEWIHLGRPLPVENAIGFRRVLSAVMDDVFALTPRILSEMVVRRRPTPVVINARKKVVLGILERYGQASLGIVGDFADQAIFRSTFLRSGLYVEEGERWRFATPEQLQDPGLAAVWEKIREFMTTPGTKSVQTLVHTLLEPPFGVREGLIPLLIAAGLKAFPAAKAVRSKASYVTDLLPSTIEDIARSPEDFLVDVVDLSDDQEEYLQALLTRFAAFAPSAAPDEDLIRRTFDAIQGWWVALAPSARTTSSLSERARRFRSLISQPDPVATLLQALPDVFGGKERDLKRTLQVIEASVEELEGVQNRYVSLARAALGSALSARGIRVGSDLREAGQAWAKMFPKDLKRPESMAGVTFAQLRRDHADELPLLNALAVLVAGRAFKDWTEATPPEFERRIRTALEDIEHAALEAGRGDDVPVAVKDGLLQLSRARLRLILSQMAELAGEARTKDVVVDEMSALRMPITEEP